jgi:hypothetical protein
MYQDVVPGRMFSGGEEADAIAPVGGNSAATTTAKTGRRTSGRIALRGLELERVTGMAVIELLHEVE